MFARAVQALAIDVGDRRFEIDLSRVRRLERVEVEAQPVLPAGVGPRFPGFVGFALLLVVVRTPERKALRLAEVEMRGDSAARRTRLRLERAI